MYAVNLIRSALHNVLVEPRRKLRDKVLIYQVQLATVCETFDKNKKVTQTSLKRFGCWCSRITVWLHDFHGSFHKRTPPGSRPLRNTQSVPHYWPGGGGNCPFTKRPLVQKWHLSGNTLRAGKRSTGVSGRHGEGVWTMFTRSPHTQTRPWDKRLTCAPSSVDDGLSRRDVKRLRFKGSPKHTALTVPVFKLCLQG